MNSGRALADRHLNPNNRDTGEKRIACMAYFPAMIRATLALITALVIGASSDLKGDMVVSPVPSKLAQQRVDKLLREAATADRIRMRSVVDELYSIAASKVPGDWLALSYYGYPLVDPDTKVHYRMTAADRSAVLLRAIPALIGQIDDAQGTSNKAWWVLINLQGACPAPERAVWERWWKERGRDQFAQGAGDK